MSDTVETREKRPTAFKGLAFLLLLIGITALLVLAAFTQRSAEGPAVAKTTPPPVVVETRTVQYENALVLEERFTGIVQPQRTSLLGFSSGGRIETINADVGDRVKQGQLLARLDTRDLKAQLAAAEASIVEARANYNIARTTVQRQQTLLDRGHVSQQRVDEVQASADAAAARIEASIAQADTLRVNIDLAAIRAPYAGTITERMGDEGAIASPAMNLLELVESGQLEARIGLPEKAAANLVVGETYRLASSTGVVEARLRADTGVIDPGRRTVTAVFDILDTESIPAGAVVRLPLDQPVDEKGFWVPVSALSEAQRGLWSIYAVEAEGSGYVTRPRLVEIVYSDADRAYVRGTMENGERFVSDGLRRLVPGQSVRPISADTAVAERPRIVGGLNP
ncbi:MAG: efflux RND transporter periplasmic adaptor subunit [Pseudomonadota bacterium]